MTPSPGEGRRPDRAALAVAAGLAALAGVIARDSMRLAGTGGYAGVGPASVPRLVAACLLGLAVWTAIAAWRGGFPPRPAQRPAPVLWIVAGLAAQMLLLHVAGFSIATGIVFACTARAFGRRNLALTLPLGIVLSLAVWLVFSRLLMLHLPAGPLEHLLIAEG